MLENISLDILFYAKIIFSGISVGVWIGWWFRDNFKTNKELN